MKYHFVSQTDSRYSYDRNGNSNRTGSAGLGQAPPLPETRRPSETDFDGSASALARRRGDAAQAKVSRMTIDTGSATSNTSFDQGLHSGSARIWNSKNDQAPSARSAPPSKISFDEREASHQSQTQPSVLSSHHNNSDQEPVRHATYSASQVNSNNHHNGTSNHLAVRSNSSQEGIRNHQLGNREGGNLGRGGLRGGMEDPNNLAANSPPTVGRNLLPESSSQGSSRQAPGSARFVPQTATLPSPAYHTTSFMRQQHGGAAGGGGGPPQATPSAAYPPRTSMPNPPPTARLPEHLRSPPSSKTQFLSLFASFYDSLGDSRTLKATLEDQVRRSNSLLQTLQRSSRVLEETVERKVRDERLVWEERTRKLEDRVKELEEKIGSKAGASTSTSSDDKGIEGSGSGSRIGTDGASSTSLDAAVNASSQNANAGSTTTTPSKRGGRNATGKAASSTSNASKGKGKATKTTRARTRRSSASTSTTGGAEADEDNQEEGAQDTESNSKESSETKKKIEEEKDELMEE